jgi:hypothetical protein
LKHQHWRHEPAVDFSVVPKSEYSAGKFSFARSWTVPISQTHSYAACQILVLLPQEIQIPEMKKFLDVAKSLAVPIFDCVESFIVQEAVASLATKLQQSSPLKIRPVLFLCGAFLEEHISFAAHFMLETGFDTRLIRDLIVAKNIDHAHFHDQRLIHSGAMLTTSKQLVYEWIATENNSAARNELLKSVNNGK